MEPLPKCRWVHNVRVCFLMFFGELGLENHTLHTLILGSFTLLSVLGKLAISF